MFKKTPTNARTIGKLMLYVTASIAIMSPTTGLSRMAYALDAGGHSWCWDEHMGDGHTGTHAELQVESVAIVPGSARLARGDQLQFQAEVRGTNGVSQDVRWSVSEPASLGTGKTAKGLLIIGKDEAPGDISVYAVSVADSTKMCEARVTVVPITITTAETRVTILAGNSHTFLATVHGSSDL